ncbi:BUD13, partial [Chaetura pelagica]
NEDSQSSDVSVPATSTLRRQRHDSPDTQRHDSPDLSPPRRERNVSPNLLPPRRQRHDSPDLSPPRRKPNVSLDLSPPRRKRHDSPDLSPPRRQRHDSPDVSPKRASSAVGKKGWKSTEQCQPRGVPGEQSQLQRGASDRSSWRQKRLPTPDLSPPRKKRHDSDPDVSPPARKRTGSPGMKRQSRTKGHGHSDSPKPAPLKGNRSRSPDSDLSPPRWALPAGREQHSSRSPPDLSPPRHRDAKGSPKKANVMFSGVKAGLVSADVLRREQQELRRQER